MRPEGCGGRSVGLMGRWGKWTWAGGRPTRPASPGGCGWTRCSGWRRGS